MAEVHKTEIKVSDLKSTDKLTGMEQKLIDDQIFFVRVNKEVFKSHDQMFGRLFRGLSKTNKDLSDVASFLPGFKDEVSNLFNETNAHSIKLEKLPTQVAEVSRESVSHKIQLDRLPTKVASQDDQIQRLRIQNNTLVSDLVETKKQVSELIVQVRELVNKESVHPDAVSTLTTEIKNEKLARAGADKKLESTLFNITHAKVQANRDAILKLGEEIESNKSSMASGEYQLSTEAIIGEKHPDHYVP